MNQSQINIFPPNDPLVVNTTPPPTTTSEPDCGFGLGVGEEFLYSRYENDDDDVTFFLESTAKIISIDSDCRVCFGYSVNPTYFQRQQGNWSSLNGGSRSEEKCMDQWSFYYLLGLTIPTTNPPPTTPDPNTCGFSYSIGSGVNFPVSRADLDGVIFSWTTSAKILDLRSSDCFVLVGYAVDPAQNAPSGNWQNDSRIQVETWLSKEAFEYATGA